MEAASLILIAAAFVIGAVAVVHAFYYAKPSTELLFPLLLLLFGVVCWGPGYFLAGVPGGIASAVLGYMVLIEVITRETGSSETRSKSGDAVNPPDQGQDRPDLQSGALQGATQASSMKTGCRIGFYILLLLVMLIPVCGVLKWLQDGYSAWQFMRKGVEVEATMVSGGFGAEPRYRFAVSGVQHFGTGGPELPGGELKVLYLASNPDVNLPAHKLRFDMVLGAGTGVALIAFVIFIVADVSRRRRVRAASMGPPDAPCS